MAPDPFLEATVEYIEALVMPARESLDTTEAVPVALV